VKRKCQSIVAIIPRLRSKDTHNPQEAALFSPLTGCCSPTPFFMNENQKPLHSCQSWADSLRAPGGEIRGPSPFQPGPQEMRSDPVIH